MFLKILSFLFFLIFSLGLFFINNLYIVLSIFFISLFLSFIFKIKLPIYSFFLFFLGINFFFNYLLSSLNNALIVTLRLLIMFIVVNLFIQKIGVNSLGEIIGQITRSEELALIITISLSFIPIMIKEIEAIKKCLVSKNFPLNFKNILTKPNVFVLTFFNNLFKRVNEMEKSFIARGVDE